MLAWLLVFHVSAVVLWIGALLVVTLMLAAHSQEAGAEARQALSRSETRIFRKMAHPGAAIVVITGILMMASYPALYLRAPWLHAKLMLVIILVFLDLRIYFRAKLLQSGKQEIQRGEWIASHAAVAVLFFAILIFVLVKPI